VVDTGSSEGREREDVIRGVDGEASRAGFLFIKVFNTYTEGINLQLFCDHPEEHNYTNYTH